MAADDKVVDIRWLQEIAVREAEISRLRVELLTIARVFETQRDNRIDLVTSIATEAVKKSRYLFPNIKDPER